MAHPQDSPLAPPPSRPPLWPALLLGLLVQAAVIAWVANSEIPARVFISSWSVSMPGILALAILLLVGLRYRGRLREALFGARSLVVVYIMVAVSGILTGYGAIQHMMPTLGAVIWRGSAGSWAKLHPHLPNWLVPKSRDVMQGMFTGESSVPWAAWLVPLLFWFLVLMALYGAMMCLAVILSRQWIHAERLSFPVAQLPLEMVSPSRTHSVFRNRLMWIGFAVPALLESLVALNYYFPAVPAVQMKHINYQPQWFPERPWSAMNPFYWGWTPFIIGFAYLAPVDVCFSVWFFNLVAKALRLVGAMMGMDTQGGGVIASRFPYPEEQAFGAFIAFAIAALWRTLPGIQRAWRERRRGTGDEEGRVLLGALAGFILCSGAVLGFFVAAGITWGASLAILTLTLLVAITLSRIRAEAGPAWVFGPYRDVTRALTVGLGTGAFTEREIAPLSLFRWAYRDVRFVPMPFHMEALKIADGAGIRKRTAIWIMALATATGILLGFYFVWTLSYQLGWGSGKVYSGPVAGATVIWNQASDWTKNRTSFDEFGFPWLVGGGVFCAFLIWMRTLFVWWPFHPIGYVMAETGAGSSFWFHYLVAWLLKFTVLRYGGHRLYVRTIPLIIGVILGDILTQCAWSAVATILNIPVYQFIS
ncbi:MAG: hypothetical protein HY320_16575 [Armatimonadetes bacterium]|nr:hypothetical protein [Armatimonadota bacterium]